MLPERRIIHHGPIQIEDDQFAKMLEKFDVVIRREIDGVSHVEANQIFASSRYQVHRHMDASVNQN